MSIRVRARTLLGYRKVLALVLGGLYCPEFPEAVPGDVPSNFEVATENFIMDPISIRPICPHPGVSMVSGHVEIEKIGLQGD